MSAGCDGTFVRRLRRRRERLDHAGAYRLRPRRTPQFGAGTGQFAAVAARLGLPELIKTYNPSLVIVELGDTMAGYGMLPTLPRALIGDQVDHLLAPIKARGLPCIWIGPPWGTDGGTYKKTNARVKEMSDYLSQIVSPCHYVDSLTFSQPGQWATQDGLHLTLQATQAWDNYLVKSIDQIVMTTASKR